ncbi:lysosomal Pro-X carboxypeptidase [Prunus yedoensis var. nudiflora]|uniref:Lysosomal Pro-X carboxypeptidase n=1 Tax=Prunus yedoensis var. nudiflora TaxID=2094558 RepID=A0A314ZS92_PRUYE|nr:lysosomal Pro-X carboxypeptidase [Prunus yedoensis var. nudiflora]
MSPSLCFSFFFLLQFPLISFSKTTPAGARFPSSLITPEKVSASAQNKLYRTKYFTQILDHFNFYPKSYQTFQQRYLINDTFWGGAKNNAPIFVYTGNEGNIEWFAQNTGFLYETAPHFKSLVVFIEHRFYGKSIPYGGKKSVAYSNATTLGYLSSTQALADYASLIIDLKKNLSATESPVVVFGGSYGGMLAAWFRLKYPHIEDTADQPGGLELLRKSFKICKNYISADYLEGWLQTAYTYTAMTDYPTPSNFLSPLPAFPVKKMCEAIDDPTTGNDTFAKLYGAANVYYNYSGTVTCFDLDDNSDPHDLGGWSWQACTEMIMPTSGNNEDSIFPASDWDYKDRASGCKSIFGIEPRPLWITTEFGGHIWKQYYLLQWLKRPLEWWGVLKNISKSIVAIVAKEGAHHVDLRFKSSEDPEWLKDVRKQEIKIIAEWISQYYHDLLNSFDHIYSESSVLCRG